MIDYKKSGRYLKFLRVKVADWYCGTISEIKSAGTGALAKLAMGVSCTLENMSIR